MQLVNMAQSAMLTSCMMGDDVAGSYKKREVLLGGNDEHGDVHRFGNTSQNSNDGSVNLVASFDTNSGKLKKNEAN